MDLQAFLSRVDLVELIGQYTALARAGKEWKGRCPFHDEKSASFHVNAEKGTYHCFGCKAGGGAVQFVMEKESLDFKEALEWLSRKFNIPLEPPGSPGANGARGQSGAFTARGEKERLYELNDAAQKFFRQQLRGPAGATAREYLAQRGIGETAIADFDLGYAPKEWQALTDLLLGQGATAKDLEKLGLIKARDREGGSGGSGHFDTFRHRLLFPIRAVTGRICAFAGRALSSEDNPKYLNVSNTPLYDKSQTLYNLDRAKGLLREEGCVIVEGYMDVIGLAQAGVRNVVASCGTALTAEHVKLLLRYADRFYLAFDSDEAGRRAAWAAGALFLARGFSPRVVDISGGKDPDEIARGAGGRERWLGLLAEAQEHGVVRYWLEQQRRAQPQADSAVLRRWVLELAALYRSLPDELIRHEVVQEIASALNMGAPEVGALLHSVGATGAAAVQARRGGSTAGYSQLKAETQQRAMLLGASVIEREILRRLLGSEKFRFVYSNTAEAQWFESALLAELFALLCDGGQDALALANHERWAGLVAELSSEELLADDDEQLIVRHRNHFVQRETQRLLTECQRATQRGDEARERELLAEIVRLKSMMRQPSSLGGGKG